MLRRGYIIEINKILDLMKNDFIEQNPNATDVQLNAYMAPQLRDLAAYSVGAKTAKTMLDDAMKNVPDNTGIDKQKLYEVSRDKLFKNPDGSGQYPFFN